MLGTSYRGWELSRGYKQYFGSHFLGRRDGIEIHADNIKDICATIDRIEGE